MNVHGTINIGQQPRGVMQRAEALVLSVVQMLHHLLALPVWRVALTIVSFITTTYGLMLLYDTLGVTDHGKGSIGFLRYLIPISVAGALHAAIFWSLTQWVTTRLAKYFFIIAFPLQVGAVGASFGTHWVHMNGGGATTEAFVMAETSTERGIRAFATSDDVVTTQTAALAQYSTAQALIEEKGGGRSCGGIAGDGKGPRYDLRMADRATFTSLNTEIAARKSQVDELVKRATTLTAGSADEAMARLASLRSLVSEAKARFESDPLLEQIRKVAEARILMGKGPIAIPPSKRGKKRETQFTCFDAELERRLDAVITAIKGLKALPEVNVPDYRDPRTGFPFALGRLAQMITTFDFSLPTRESLKAERIRALGSRNAAQAERGWSDLTPLSVAAAIELLLALLFLLGRGTLPRHPGMERLVELLARANVAVFDRIWQALGGSEDPNAVRNALDSYSKFENRYNWVLVPLYGNDHETQVLHRVMEVMAEVGLARRAYTGRGIMARWYMRGWDPIRRERVAKQAVRIYRMSATEYMAFILDALKREGANKTLADKQHQFVNDTPIYGQANVAAENATATRITGAPEKDITHTEPFDDAVSALINLGYRRSQADAVISAVASRNGGEKTEASQLIRLGLKELAK